MNILQRMGSAKKGGSALIHDAASRGELDAVKDQIKCGVDVNCLRDGWTPLHMACQNGHSSVIGLLLKSGANVDAHGPFGPTPLHLCCHKGFLQAVQMLLLFAADVNSLDRDGCSSLHYAAIWGHADVVEILLQRGAQPNAQNVDAWTPLHYATRNGHSECASILIDHGARLDIPDTDGLTPRDVAFGNDMKRLLYEIDSNGPDQIAVLMDLLAKKDAELAQMQGRLANSSASRLNSIDKPGPKQAKYFATLDEEEEEDFLPGVNQPRTMDVNTIAHVHFTSDMLHNSDTPRSGSVYTITRRDTNLSADAMTSRSRRDQMSSSRKDRIAGAGEEVTALLRRMEIEPPVPLFSPVHHSERVYAEQTAVS